MGKAFAELPTASSAASDDMVHAVASALLPCPSPHPVGPMSDALILRTHLLNAGTYTAKPGATKCDPCPAGTYQPDKGAAQCIPCPAGSYSAEPGELWALPARIGCSLMSCYRQRVQHAGCLRCSGPAVVGACHPAVCMLGSIDSLTTLYLLCCRCDCLHKG